MALRVRRRVLFMPTWPRHRILLATSPNGLHRRLRTNEEHSGPSESVPERLADVPVAAPWIVWAQAAQARRVACANCLRCCRRTYPRNCCRPSSDDVDIGPPVSASPSPPERVRFVLGVRDVHDGPDTPALLNAPIVRPSTWTRPRSRGRRGCRRCASAGIRAIC